jgi:hypothetical protein
MIQVSRLLLLASGFWLLASGFWLLAKEYALTRGHGTGSTVLQSMANSQ